MGAKQSLKSSINPQRERFSNFVVDLRKSKPAPSSSFAGVAPVLRQQLDQLSGRAKRIRPNLLYQEKRIWSSVRNFFSFNVSWRSLFKHRRSPWQEFKKQREQEFKILSASVRQSFSQKKIILAPRDSELRHWYRPLLSFFIVLVIIIIPFKLLAYFHVGDFSSWEEEIKQRSQAAVGNLLAGAEAVTRQDFQEAEGNFQAASVDFLAAQAELNNISDGLLSLARFSNDPQLKLASQSKKFLEAGIISASLGRSLVLASDSLFDNQPEDFSLRLSSFLDYGQQAVKDAQSLEKVVSGIDATNLPVAYRSQFIALSNQASHLSSTLADFVGVVKNLKDILGLTRDRRYLVVFQNNAELRASGGFLGSYALVDIRQGGIRNLEVPAGGSYDTEAGRRVSVAAPEPLWLVDTLWHFWDANWWPDWPKTARNLMWFYEKSGGPTVDGVISVTPSVVESLLEITGPIDMGEEYGVIIDANNFWQTVEMVVERDNLAISHPELTTTIVTAPPTPIKSVIPLRQDLEQNSDNKPKKIIGDLLVKIMETLPNHLNRDNLSKIIDVLEKNIAAKHVLLYFSDSNLQTEVENHNWGGEIRQSAADYLMVVNTNIAGQKSDRLMKEDIRHQSEVSSDGSIINTLTITRTHSGLKNEPLTGVRNVDWMRVYVPLNSVLIEVSGFRRPDPSYLQDRPELGWQRSPELEAENSARLDENSLTKIYQENGKTVFANWLMVDPGETAVVNIKYRLPFNFYQLNNSQKWYQKMNTWLNPDDRGLIPYSLLVQKQPGAAPSLFSSQLRLSSEAEVFWRYPDNTESALTGWDISSQIDRDKYWSILVKNNKR